MAKKTIKSKVRGVDQKNDDGFERQELIRSYCKDGTLLVLQREPDNPYDKNAIGVWITAKTRGFTCEAQIGFVGKDLAAELASIMDRGGKASARITEVTGGTRDKPTRGVNIEIEVED